MNAAACACGHHNRAGARFCAQCGGALQGAATDAAAPSRRPSRRPPSYEALRARLWPPAVLLLLLTLINVALALRAGAAGATPLQLLAATLLGDALIVGFALPHRAALVALLDPGRLRVIDLPLVALAWVGLLGFMALYGLALSPFGIEVEGGDAGLSAHGWPTWSALLVLAVQPALFEELAFRGYLMERLGGVLSRGEVLLLQAALFAVVHMLPLMFVSHFVMGLLLGLLRERGGSLYPPILLHAAWNAFAVLG